MLKLSPSIVPSLQQSGSKVIIVKAEGYQDAEVVQQIAPGAVSVTKSTVAVIPALNENTKTTFTMTAKDQYENVVAGCQFKYDVIITNSNPATQEVYNINGANVSMAGPIVPNMTNLTDINGQTTFDITLPAHIDSGDGITITPRIFNSGYSEIIGDPYTFRK